MRAFVNWALSARYRLMLLAATFALLFPPVSAALLVLQTLKHGPAQGTTTALFALLILVAGGLLAGAGMPLLLTVGGLSMFSGVAMGTVAGSAQSLALAFQGTVLGALALAAIMTLFVPDPEFLVAPIREQMLEFARAGNATAQQIDIIREWDPSLLLGSMFAGLTMLLLAALMLGSWWFSFVKEEVRFGEAFRRLRLGRVLGIGCMLMLAVSFATDMPLVENLAAIGMPAFLFQGLAVMHAWGHAKGWHWGALLIAYLSLLIAPLNILTVFALCATGLLDNIFSLRAPLTRQA